MTYEVRGLDDDPVEFDDGASLLVTGPSEVLEDVVFDAMTGEETVVVVTTNRGGPAVAERLVGAGVQAERTGVVDASSGEVTDDASEGVTVRSLGSPGDLTGLSVEFAKLVDGFQEDGVGDRVRVGVVTVSTLLMYADVRTVFRFLHVFTSRIRSGSYLGVFALDDEMHDDQTVNTVRAIFDAEARLDGDGDVTLRGGGFSGS